MTKKWYNIYTDERNGKKVEQLLQELGLRYSVKYSGFVVYFSINVNENFWQGKLRKCIEQAGVYIKFTKNNMAEANLPYDNKTELRNAGLDSARP